MDPLSEQIQTAWLQIVDADSSIDRTTITLDEIREDVARLMGGEGSDIYNISAELLKV